MTGRILPCANEPPEEGPFKGFRLVGVGIGVGGSDEDPEPKRRVPGPVPVNGLFR